MHCCSMNAYSVVATLKKNLPEYFVLTCGRDAKTLVVSACARIQTLVLSLVPEPAVETFTSFDHVVLQPKL